MQSSILLIFHTVCCNPYSKLLCCTDPDTFLCPEKVNSLRCWHSCVIWVSSVNVTSDQIWRSGCNHSHNFTTLAWSSWIRFCTSGDDSNKRCSWTILCTSVGIPLIVVVILLTFEYALHSTATTTSLSSSSSFRCSAFTPDKDPTALKILCIFWKSVSAWNSIWLSSLVSRCGT